MAKKILICNVHNDVKINDFTAQYILKKHEEKPDLYVVSENILYSERTMEQPTLRKMDDTSMVALVETLDNKSIQRFGIMDEAIAHELAAEEETSTAIGDFSTWLGSLSGAQQKHDQFMYEKLTMEFEGDFIAIIGAHHVIKWLVESKLNDDFQVIVPMYNNLLENMTARKGSGKEWTDEAREQAFVVYSQVLQLPEINSNVNVVDIDEQSAIMGDITYIS